MHFDSMMSREWKTPLKGVVGIFSLFAIVLISPVTTEAVEWKRAVVEARDGHVYEIQYTRDLRIENFFIHGLDGEGPSREVAAELYMAAYILNKPPTDSDIYSGDELVNWVHTETAHTSRWKGYHRLATIVGSVSAGYLVGVLTGAVKVTASLIQTEAVQNAIQVLTTVTLFIGEEQVMSEAYIAAWVFAERARSKRQIFDNMLSSAENGAEVSIEEIKSAYNALLQAHNYVRAVHWLMKKHLILPDREERLVKFVLSVSPLTSLGYFFFSAGQNIENLQDVRAEFHKKGSQISEAVSAAIDIEFTRAMSDLASAGFFDREPPTIAESIKDMQLTVGDDARLLDLTTLFNDRNGDRLEHSVEVTDKSVAVVEFIFFRPDGELVFKPFLQIIPKRVGSTSITIEATDPTRLSATQTFTITVVPAEAPNQPPEAVGTIPSQSLTMGNASPPLELSTFFRDPDGDMLFYTAESSNPAVATTRRTRSQLTLVPRGIGSATITVTAANSDGPSATQTFTVTIAATERLPVRPTPQGLRVGNAVIVQNTAPIALNIRGGPGLGWKKKGQASDGATGTITEGPRQARGYTWWKIRWDVSNNVVWMDRPAGNQGWSVEALLEEGVRLIAPLSQFPDLVVESVSVDKTTLAPSEGFRLDTTIGNQGDARSSPTTLRFYRSSDPNISLNDTQLHEQTVHRISVGQQITPWKRFTAPKVPGIYYYGVCVDTAGHERAIDNNCSKAIQVTVKTPDLPDLIVESISVSKSTLVPGERFTISATVRNIGTGRAQSPVLSYYGPNLSQVGSRNIPRLSPNQERKVSISLKAPDAPGTYYYDACVKQVRGDEVNKNNNCSTRVAITVGTPVNQVPIVSNAIPDRTLIAGSASVVVDISGHFRDPDGDALSYEVRSDDTGVATASVSGSQVTLTPKDAGIATITVTASDGELTATQRFSVTVTAAPVANQAPLTVGLIPNQTLPLNADVVRLDLSDYFSDADDDTLTYTTTVDNTSIALLQTVKSYLSIYPLRTGRANVRVMASDGNLAATQEFIVLVQPLEEEQPTNQPPSAIGTIAPQTLTVNGGAQRLDVSTHFHDSDSDTLTYTAGSSDTSVATTRVSGDFLTITPLRAGSATITVTASDGYLIATHRFTATVQSASFQVGDRVIVQNASGGGLNGLLVRNGAGTGFTHVISVFNGATGTITDGPESANGYTWWKVSWDRSDQVVCDVNPCVGWVIEFFRGTRVITENTAPPVTTPPVWDPASVVQPPKQPQNQAPVTVGAIPDQTLSANGALVQLNLSNYFRDADGDTLTYKTTSDNTNVASLQVVGASVSILPLSTVGRANVRVTASDGNLTATQDFRVIVERTQPVNRPPAAIGTISPVTFTVNAPAQRVNVSNYFGDSDGDSLTYRARSDNTNVATVSVSGAEVRITPQNAGNTTVHVTASDGSLEATQSISVTVTPVPQVQNRAPVASGSIPTQMLTVGAAAGVQVSGYFSDPDSDSLTYTAGSSDTNVATTRVSGDFLTITPLRAGSATITVTANDGGLTATHRFTATVQAASFRVGDRVIVQNASGGGLNGLLVRNGAGTGFAHIISVFNGATGTITDGPESANGYTWWQVAWDRSDQVLCDVNPCVGWVFESFRGTRVIAVNNTPPVTTPQPIQASPDLVIESVRVSDDTLAPRESFKFYATVRNQGAGEASRTTLRYYRSSDATISTSDTEVDTDSVTSLDPNETGEEWDSLSAPREPGIYYYGVCVDNVTDESRTNNNCSTGIRVTVAASVPDLVIESVRVSDNTVEVGDRFTFYATVRNRGNGEARRTTLRYYRSSDSNISERDTEEGTDSVSSLDADETSEERTTLTAPNQSGTYYYGVCVDNVRDESNTNNNCSTGISVTVADAIIVRPPPGLRKRDSIVVQNASGGGLNGLRVRAGAGTGFAHIASVFNGATGTITDGPKSANGYTWWKVSWDRSDQVFCDVNPCVGWVIESFRGTKVIAKDDALAAPPLNAVIPTETVLLSNYPNPFNPETWIPYQLSASVDVSVSIYAVDGRLVRRLDLGHQSAGVYRSRNRAAYWDGRNAFGERVASGLYFYTLTAGDFTATRKMLIRK